MTRPFFERDLVIEQHVCNGKIVDRFVKQTQEGERHYRPHWLPSGSHFPTWLESQLAKDSQAANLLSVQGWRRQIY